MEDSILPSPVEIWEDFLEEAEVKPRTEVVKLSRQMLTFMPRGSKPRTREVRMWELGAERWGLCEVQSGLSAWAVTSQG